MQKIATCIHMGKSSDLGAVLQVLTAHNVDLAATRLGRSYTPTVGGVLS